MPVDAYTCHGSDTHCHAKARLGSYARSKERALHCCCVPNLGLQPCTTGQHVTAAAGAQSQPSRHLACMLHRHRWHALGSIQDTCASLHQGTTRVIPTNTHSGVRQRGLHAASKQARACLNDGLLQRLGVIKGAHVVISRAQEVMCAATPGKRHLAWTLPTPERAVCAAEAAGTATGSVVGRPSRQVMDIKGQYSLEW